MFDTDKLELQGFIEENVAPATTVFTDEHPTYRGLPKHETVKHAVQAFIREQAHTNGVKSFSAKLKCGYDGGYHWMSAKHLDRYVQEFAERYNIRPRNTIHQLERVARAMVGQSMTLEAVTAHNA